MTHFANAYAEGPKAEEPTRQQTERFDKIVAELGIDKPMILHIANSAAALRFPWTRKDMVRVGTATYGEDVDEIDNKKKLLPVVRAFKSRVAIIENNIPPSSPVSYDSLQHTSADRLSTTATLRVGYSEGFPEMAFSRRMMLLIRGRKFPVIGKTSMNMVVVDITDQDKENPVQLGDEAVIIGKQGQQEITFKDFIAKSEMTITQLIIMLGYANPAIVTGKPNKETP